MQRLGRYELGRLLGEGGAGRVHEALLVGSGGLRKRVALKILRTGSEELRREAWIGGLLRHPNLVDVYEVGFDQGQAFLAMELCDGALADRMPLSPRAVVEVGLQVCAALQYAHEELGLVHLDLKPGNLLYAGATIKVADLGIARASGHQGDGRIRGTPGYMAPEQRFPGELDARADLYALGVTLLELATAYTPAASGTLDLGSFTAEGEGFAGALEADPIPAWLAPALARCLADHKDDRWPSMSALADALRDLEVDGPGLREALGAPEDDADGSGRLGDEPDAFVGRQEELRRLADHLAGACVVALKGPAGIGKSRLAAAAARAWRTATGGRGWRCDLAGVSTSDGFHSALARALDVALVPGDSDSQLRHLAHAIAGRGDCVVVLDGFDALADLAGSVGRLAGPRARILVTSRAALPFASLEVGPLGPVASVDLLMARAASRGAVVAGDPDLPALADRLEGLPLALELAAGRLGVLSVRDVLDRLGLSLLRGASGGRHGTLRAALDWSRDLLAPAERSAFAQLSVFVGPFRSDAAEAVLDPPSEDDLLTALLDRSLLTRGADGRLSMLAVVQAYAAELLGPDPGPAVRHGRVFARHGAQDALDALQGPDGIARRRALALELDDVVTACRRAVARADAPVAVATLQAAWAVLNLRGPLQTASELSQAVGALTLEPEQRATVDAVAGFVAATRGRFGEARPYLLSALALREGNGELREQAFLQTLLGTVEREEGRRDLARERLADALSLARQCGAAWVEARAHAELARVDQDDARLGDALPHLGDALALARRVGDRRLEGMVLGQLARVHHMAGRFREARAACLASTAISQEIGDRRQEAITVGLMAGLDHQCGRVGDARVGYQAALALAREVGFRLFEGSMLGNLGVLSNDQGAPGEAATYLAAALAIHREVGNRHSEAVVLAALAEVHRAEGRVDEARGDLEAALALHRGTANLRGEGVALGLIGELEHGQGNLGAARDRFEAALAIAREAGNALDEAMLLGDLGRVDRDEGKPAEALARAQASLRLHGEIGNRGGEARMLALLGDLAEGRGEPDVARAHWEAARSAFDEVGDPASAARVTERLARIP